MTRLLPTLALAAWLASLATTARATEELFTYVDSLPSAPGELRESSSAASPEAGIEVRKKLYVLEHGDTAILTTVVGVACAGAPEGSAVPYMVAAKQQVKTPQSFAAAALLDIYTAVYVRDHDGRIRLYERLTGLEIAELTRTFMPACVAL